MVAPTVRLLAVLALSGSACRARPTAAAPDAGPEKSEAPASAPASATASVTGQDLVFVGTVTDIQPGHWEGAHERWAVTTHVERVLSGRYDREGFSFAVHSPSRAGLSVGGQYTIRATWSGEGYVVDERQWRRPAKDKPE